MRIARADKRDMDMAFELCGVLDVIERGNNSSPDEPDYFDTDDGERCCQIVRKLYGISRKGSIDRVVWGMAAMLDPKNMATDPDSDVLEFHPVIKRLWKAAKTLVDAESDTDIEEAKIMAKEAVEKSGTVFCD